jgi:toxin ParE1/3/4
VKLVWRHRAELQLRSQLEYLKGVSPLAESRMRARIEQRIARLKRAPMTGRPSRAEGVRELVIAGTPYVAVYQVANDTVTVLQFLHTSQDRSDE